MAAIQRQILQGHHVRLEPLAEHHLRGLALAIEDGELWKIPVTIVPHPKELPQFLGIAEAQFQAGKELTFATIEQSSGNVVGCTRYRSIEFSHKRLEIGFTFIAKSWQRSPVNTEAKLLMLTHAFDQLMFNRVELITDVLNEKSRTAIARIGAKEEGILRKHMVMPDGRIRDSALYSITSDEWPIVKANLEVRLLAG